MFRNPFSSTTIGGTNPIRTLGDYSKPSHEGYKNTIELPVGNNVVPLRSDTIRLVQNGCSFHGLRSEDPNQHLKDFLKLVDSLDLDGSITTWEDLTTRFLTQFFPPGRTVKLQNDILLFQQHHGESLSDRRTINQSSGGKLRDKNAKESWALLEDLALYDNERRVKGLKVFVGNFTYECDFMVLEDTTSVIDHDLGSVIFGKPFVEATGLVYIRKEGTITFEKDKEKIVFKMPHKMEMFKRIDFTDIRTNRIPPFAIESDDDKNKKTHYSDSLDLGPEYKHDENVCRAIRSLIGMRQKKLWSKSREDV
ncbi:zinc finger, CCHC-type containing protein [Tanacetum coccineum]